MTIARAPFRTKDIDTVVRQNGGSPDPEHPGLSKRLGGVALMGLGVGLVIGTGIFTLTGIAAKNHAGPAIVLSFAGFREVRSSVVVRLACDEREETV